MSTPSSSDWRSQLQLHVREKVIGNIMETLKNNVNKSDANNLKEMLRIAVQFEEATYAAAASTDDYFRNISTKLIYVETMNQPSAPTNSGLTTSSSRPSAQFNPKISASASNVSGLSQLCFMNQNLRHAGNTGTTDWQEEVYQKLDSPVPSEKHAEQLRIPNNLTVKLDRAIEHLMLPNDKITADILKKVTVYEEPISKFISRCKERKIAQANQSQQINLEASDTSSKHQNFLPCATYTSQSNVGPVQSSSQFDSTVELNYLRIKDRSSTHRSIYEYSAGQRQNYYNQLMKEATPCQNVPISLPQYCHNSSRKTKDSVMLSSSPNSKLPTESASSPLVDSEEEKLALPLLAESYSQDGNQGAAETSKTSVRKQPIDCLIKSFLSLEPEYLRPAIESIEPLVAMNDMIPILKRGYGYNGSMIEDIAELTNYCPPSKKMKWDITAIPQNVSSIGNVNGEFKQKLDFISSEVKSTDTTFVKGIKYEINHSLIKEIREINHKQIELVLEVSEEDTTSGYRSGNVVKCSYSTASLCSDLKARLCHSQMSSILPLRLWVPPEYPKCSPFPMIDLGIEPSMELGAIYRKTRSRFDRSACCLSEPISVKDLANTWGTCAREAILEYAKN